MKTPKQSALLVLFCVALGFCLANFFSSPAANAQVGAPVGPMRFQISSFAGSQGDTHGAYVVDTMTGIVWIVVPGQQPKRVSQNLP